MQQNPNPKVVILNDVTLRFSVMARSYRMALIGRKWSDEF
ncbi:hypothetical protein SAMN05421747_1258 [Parapedobacter composti]|uniref:Uncharacterized protein n=1 Tax=Parapedobacter composti TaxID=623281 RepID=A0A1I1M7S3_9SPHI|nr:hypothetical protein SAMN05421747_1258 [Parapedobacter composti]